MKIICGLGNPGDEYARHRHNVGFMVCESLVARAKGSFTQVKFDAELAQVMVAGERALVIKPQTFMNLSGRALGAAARFYKVEAADVLVVHDELDLPFGKLQLKAGGGTGGHNGLESIGESWGEAGYGRLRFGIGKPQGPNAKERVIGHVLGNFSGEEAKELDGLLVAAAEMAEGWAREGMQKAMNRFNRR
ncbi:MAG: aminoacyl-tRNA hydrolase [Myxococcaceae bacterium]|nr:aminoacyl-tRNA hydrolase [Myxococcaceae bacterium]